jgi:phosphatidate cytidylyltransferase
LRRIITASILIVSFLIAFFFLPPFVLSAFFIICMLYVLCYEWPRFFNHHSWQFWLIFPFYPLIPFILLILLNQNLEMRILLPIMIALTSSFDTGAYLTGSLIGTHKLIPHISPKKTWEGLGGGIIFCFLTLLIICWYAGTQPTGRSVILIAVITSLLALIGDLFESWLKRNAGIKDSGSLLPGHGGILDRFDSLLFVIFFFYFCKEYLISLFR